MFLLSIFFVGATPARDVFLLNRDQNARVIRSVAHMHGPVSLEPFTNRHDA